MTSFEAVCTVHCGVSPPNFGSPADMNPHRRLLLLCVRGLSTYHPDKGGIDEHVASLLESGECAVSLFNVAMDGTPRPCSLY